MALLQVRLEAFAEGADVTLGAETLRWDGWPSCPCGCSTTALKLTRAGHVPKCSCRSCTGRRSQRKGKAGQAKTHRALGGTGFTPSNEESARPYTVEVTVMPEVKVGAQIPASWDKFVGSAWFEDALSQTRRAVPVGSNALPCVVLRGDWAVIDIRAKRNR